MWSSRTASRGSCHVMNPLASETEEPCTYLRLVYLVTIERITWIPKIDQHISFLTKQTTKLWDEVEDCLYSSEETPPALDL